MTRLGLLATVLVVLAASWLVVAATLSGQANHSRRGKSVCAYCR